jgi:hypothetical protein
MQPVDGAFDKIGGVSSGSAGKTQEASRQLAEVVKCNHVKNQVSMEIAHPQAAHLQAAQAFWGRQNQLTADVGQAGKCRPSSTFLEDYHSWIHCCLCWRWELSIQTQARTSVA